MKNLLIALMALASYSAFSQDCFTNAKLKIDQLEKDQDAVFGTPREGNESVLLKGAASKGAVILLHGITGSPFEVIRLGEELNSKGITVYMPLLAGFGRSTEIANQVKWRNWVSQTTEAFHILKECHSEISLAGFSLGASVVSYMALTDESVREHLGSLTLLSPALVLKNRLVLDIASPFFGLLHNKIDIQSANKVAVSLGINDLNIPSTNQHYFNDSFPLKALRQLRKLNRNISFSDFDLLETNSINIFYSENDKTVNAHLAWKKISSKHRQLTTKTILKNKKVKHQILVNDGTQVDSEFEEFIQFIASSMDK